MTDSDVQELADELCEIDTVTSGTRAEGTITGIDKRVYQGDELIVLTVELPHDVFCESFDKPVPPVDEYKFTRVAETYGQGLVDITSLSGEPVECDYDTNAEDWLVVDPDESGNQSDSDWTAEETVGLIGLLLWTVIVIAIVLVLT